MSPTMKKSLLSVPSLLLLVLAVVATPAPAQDLQAVFGETVDVRVINVEVVVTDKDGLPVLDLEPEDFRLFVDGEEVPIDYFTEIRGGVAIAPEPTEDEPEARAPRNLPSVEPGEPVPTSYLLFIDEFFSIQRDRNHVLDAMIEQLPLLGENDRMAVVAYDGEELEMLSSWTGSATRLREILEDAKFRPAYGLQRVAELRFFENTRIDPNVPRDSSFDLSFEEQQYARDLARQVERSVLAATATLRGFAKPPGRKVMLMLSGGWPLSPARYTVDSVAAARPIIDPTVPDGDELFNPLIRTANLLGYTLYPVDVPGLTTSAAAQASGFGPSRTVESIDDPTGRAVLPDTSGARSARELEQESALRFVARETGGKALVNAQRTVAFEQVAQDTRTYYWLGFNSERRSDDDKRNIKVRVDRPGVKVRARDSIQDLSRQEEVSLAVESALLFGSPPGFDNLPVATGELKRDGRRFVLLPLAIAIPLDNVTLVPQGDVYLTQLELRIAAVSETGDRSDIPVVPLNFRLEEEPESGKFLPYQTQVKLRRQPQRVVVSLYDTLGSTLYSNVVQVNPNREKK